MATLRILSSEGDYATDFTVDAHKEAQDLFDRLSRNYSAFKITAPNEPALHINAFDPTADEIVMVPKIVGG